MERTPCQEFRDVAFAPDGFASSHAQACAPCARWAARHDAREELVRSLPRLAAPATLDGRVVSALQAGARQERAIRALRELSRVSTPRELDRVVAGVADVAGAPASALSGLRANAPSVLDRLVSEELVDPAQARVRRFVGSLPRLHAPCELEALVAHGVAGADRARSAPRSRARLVWGTLAAAALILAVAAPILVDRSIRESRHSFRVERVESIGALDPLAYGLLDSVSGGLLSLHKI